MFTIKTTSRLTICLIAILSALLLCSCSSDNDSKSKKEREKHSALSNSPGLKKRFTQLNATLEQMDRESEIQKAKISAAKAELHAIHEILAQNKLQDLGLVEFTTGGITEAAMGTTAAASAPSSEEREDARDGVLGTLTIVLFLLFAAVFLGKLWRDREYAPSTVREYSSGGGTSGATLYDDAGPAARDANITPPIG